MTRVNVRDKIDALMAEKKDIERMLGIYIEFLKHGFDEVDEPDALPKDPSKIVS